MAEIPTYLHLYKTKQAHDADYSRSSANYLEPWVAYVTATDEVTYNLHHDYSLDYLTTTAREDGAISFNIWHSMGTEYITSISYSTDNGQTWNTTANTDNKQQNLVIDVDVEAGDKVMWKGAAKQTGFYDSGEGDFVGSFFSSSGEFDVEGNVMSLLYGDDFVGETTLENDDALELLFYDYTGEKTCGVVNAKKMILPATTLADSCYFYMFNGCTSLVSAPALPATTLASNCYNHMFYGCTSLASAPVLPATTLADSCYSGMFKGCTSLVSAPALPATVLVSNCYREMFMGCTSLASAPVLPATTLASGCYYGMFNGCTSLVSAPALPATTLVTYCYREMFNGCSSLNYIKAMFSTTPSNTYTQNWVNGVAATGTFVKNSAATWNVTGTNGVPSGWTVETASE